MTQTCKVCPAGTHGKYDFPTRPFDVVTIGHGGWTGQFRCTNGTSSHYGHTFVDRLSPETLVIDLTVMDDKALVHFAVSGPMLSAELPAGTARGFTGADPVLVAALLETTGIPMSGLTQVSTDIYAFLANQAGAAVCTGDQFVCDTAPWRPEDTVCADCTRSATLTSNRESLT